MDMTRRNLELLYKQIIQLKPYVMVILLGIIASYSVYIVYDAYTVGDLFGREDSIVENLGALCFFLTSIVALFIFLRTRNIFFLLLCLVFFLGAGEEVSWGQRIFNFETPAAMKEMNVQGEFNLHNIEIFNSANFDKTYKQGLEKLLTINFLYKLFWASWCIILPLLVFNFDALNRLATKIRLPIPPIAIGVFFAVNWLTFKSLDSVILPRGHSAHYYAASKEIYESLSAFIFLVLMVYFYRQVESSARAEHGEEAVQASTET
ncbi:hypothetical protein F0M18_14245 [Pseudohalioglobus sediminis]|uniref:Uncharacterized protein n=1 Tax=Pseudohalioglobus sediminis TaxID=2606449 RepID=A0A5B0WT74_9GAMM|nr:hypothetical protein [Pseudohalioglobus sediminis]KAA1189515.1 hypothetical protein F0M18_14245 [Pseudohalioglobus sediminis]